MTTKFLSSGSHTQEQVDDLVECHFYCSSTDFLAGFPTLFLPVEAKDNAGGVSSQILEIQAVNPVDSRSWFIEDEVISGGWFIS